jgi:putative thiamine transport system ATP-binding protein
MALTLSNVSIHLGVTALIRSLSLSIAQGEIVTLMGRSGAGKSTLLSLIAGDLEAPFTAAGSVSLGGKILDDVPPEARRIGRLFQDDLLFPHLTVGENLLFGMARKPRAERLQAMEAALDAAELSGFSSRPPHTLSGGQRARVALMRTLVAAPRALLLDEPFGKLDAKLRDEIRRFVFGHARAEGLPTLLVTHDEADAAAAGGRILAVGA